MEHNFINKTTFVTNLVLLTILILFMILVNNTVICPPPNFILNTDNHTIDGCKNTRGDLMNSSDVEEDKNRTLSAEKKFYKDSYWLDLLMFSLVIPLGITSLIMSLSSLWIEEAQDLIKPMCPIKKSQPIQIRRTYFQIDSLKAIIVLICTIFWIIYLTPIGFGVANWTAQCHITPKVCISIVLYFDSIALQ